MYLSLGPRLLLFGILYPTSWSYCVPAIINGDVLRLGEFEMHLFA